MLFSHRLSCRGLHQQPADGARLCHRPTDLRPHGPGPGANSHCIDGQVKLKLRLEKSLLDTSLIVFNSRCSTQLLNA